MKAEDAPPALGNILEYYRKRVDEMQKEREDWFEQLEKLRISQEDYHKLEWELRKKDEEIADLQQTVSEAQIKLFDEREQVLMLKREIADLKALSIEDRNKILQLVTLNAKADENQYYYKDMPLGNIKVECSIKYLSEVIAYT